MIGLKEIQPVRSKGNQSWIFIGRSDAEAEIPILWPPDAKNGLIWKDPEAGKDWRWEKGTTEDENGWMASPTQQTWVWVNSGCGWWTERPGVLQSMGLQRVGHDWMTELNWTKLNDTSCQGTLDILFLDTRKWSHPITNIIYSCL